MAPPWSNISLTYLSSHRETLGQPPLDVVQVYSWDADDHICVGIQRSGVEERDNPVDGGLVPVHLPVADHHKLPLVSAHRCAVPSHENDEDARFQFMMIQYNPDSTCPSVPRPIDVLTNLSYYAMV